MPAKPTRKGIFDGSHGVMLPSALPALDVTTAIASGRRVNRTMMKLFRCSHNKKPSRVHIEYAIAKARNEKTGIQV
jgi:hypothetical protein